MRLTQRPSTTMQRWQPFIFLAASFLAGSGCKLSQLPTAHDLASPPAQPTATTKTRTVIRPVAGRKFHGVFLPTLTGRPTQAAIDAYISKTGAKPHVVMWFEAFSRDKLRIPTATCDLLARNNITPFIILELMDPKNGSPSGNPYSYDKVLSGGVDDLLENFATSVKACDIPLFVGIGHEVNGNWYPWSGVFNNANKDLNNNGVPDGPEKAILGFRYIVRKVTYEYNARKISWVLVVNGDTVPNEAWNNPHHYWPGDDYADWIAINQYNTTDYGTPWLSLEQQIGSLIASLSVYNTPMMIGETGCDEDTPYDRNIGKPKWASEAITWIAKNNFLNGFVYFDENKPEEGTPKNYGLNHPPTINAFTRGLRTHAGFFHNPLQTVEIPHRIPSTALKPNKWAPPNDGILIAGRAKINPPSSRVTSQGKGKIYLNYSRRNLAKASSIKMVFRLSHEAKTSFNEAKYRIDIPGTDISVTKETNVSREFTISLSREQIHKALDANNARIAVEAEVLHPGDWYAGIFLKGISIIK